MLGANRDATAGEDENAVKKVSTARAKNEV